MRDMRTPRRQGASQLHLERVSRKIVDDEARHAVVAAPPG